MKTYPLINDENRFQYGFEIENIYVGLKKIVKILSSIKGVTNIKPRKLFDFSKKHLVEFDYSGEKFFVFEPFGDNSRYWIAPKNNPNSKINISEIENAFYRYNPPFFISILGDLASFNFKNILRICNKK